MRMTGAGVRVLFSCSCGKLLHALSVQVSAAGHFSALSLSMFAVLDLRLIRLFILGDAILDCGRIIGHNRYFDQKKCT